MRRVALTCALALLTIVAASAMQNPAPSAVPAVDRLGPQVGERVPDFTLNDQHGRPRALQSLSGPRGLMLVFFRSADW
jgi:hypothetical protein